jgi:Flp pilus assembly protein TadB
VPITPESARETIEEVYSLALKYDLVVFDPQRRALHEPMAEMSAYASATFWPRGAIQAATAGGAGAVIAVVAWFVGIPIVSGVAVIIGAFLFAMSVLTFGAEGRKRIGRPPGRSTTPGP